MFQKIAFTFALIAAVPAFAGDNGGGTLNCVSDSGRTKIYGMAGTDFNGMGPASLTLEIDGVKTVMNAGVPVNDNAVLVDFVNYAHKTSYAVTIKRAYTHASGSEKFVITDSVLKLVSVKGSMKAKSSVVFEFLADLPAGGSLDPRTSPDLTNIDLSEKKLNKDVQVKCTLDVGV